MPTPDSLREAAEEIVRRPVDDAATIAAARELLSAERDNDGSPAATRRAAQARASLQRCIHGGEWPPPMTPEARRLALMIR